MRKMLAVLFLIAVCASNVFAWGEEGHRMVCRIAYLSLSPDDQKEVDRLTKAYKTPPGMSLQISSFPDACVFADEARRQARDAEKAGSTTSPWLHFKSFSNWHFLNVARSVKKIQGKACNNDCALTGITTHSGMLKNGKTDQERAEGLVFLGHWVGDIHQPLHVSYADDLGGNNIKPVTGGFYPIPNGFPLNLHAVWDGSIIRIMIAGPGWRAFADGLQAKITATQKTAWSTSTPLAWAQESYDVTTLAGVEYCKKTSTGCEAFGTGRVLTKAYQDQFAKVVDLRLQKAGTRLAALIHESLHP
jgi:hypothetical protein